MNLGSTEIETVIDVDLSSMPYKALPQLRLNVEFLLMKRGWTQADVAQEIGIDPSTFNKFLHGRREIQFKHLDGLAAVFGIHIYELFQPGISPLGERRVLKDRRMGIDRRKAHLDRLAHVPFGESPKRKKRVAS